MSILLLLPIAAMLLMAISPKPQLHKYVAIFATSLQLIWVGVGLYPRFWQEAIVEKKAFACVDSAPWIMADLGKWGKLSITWILGADGLSFSMIVLTCLIMWIAIISAWHTEKQGKAFFMLLMLLNASLIGCFAALDFFLFFLCYELMLLPMFFLIGVWGGERREYAALKFFIYTLAGSVLILVVMAGIAFSFTDPILSQAGKPVHTFNMMHILSSKEGVLTNLVAGSIFDKGSLLWGQNARLLAFAALFIAFAIKVPIVPLHTWLPDAHVEAPTSISVILAGILLKVGGYGILRICYGMFPEGAIHFGKWIAVLGVISMIYGALVAMAQKDFKALIAYSSISHLGYTLLGMASLNEAGVNGAVLQMFTHGITSAALFLLVGVLYDRVHDRRIQNFTGLWGKMPHFAFFTLLTFFASLGLPGLCSFVAEMLVFMGAFQSHQETHTVPLALAVSATITIVLGATYLLRTYRQMFFGKFAATGSDDWEGKLQDLSPREYIMFVPLAALMLLLGIFPQLILQLQETTVTAFVAQVWETGNALLLQVR